MAMKRGFLLAGSVSLVLVMLAYTFMQRPFVTPVFSWGKAKDQHAEREGMLFVGDVMLGRRVETLMNMHGVEYPFQKSTELLQKYALTIGNFEAPIPSEHVQAPDFTFRFSVKGEYLDSVKKSGFDVLSLANNHTLDYGTEGLVNTFTTCVTYEIVCIGDPRKSLYDTHIFSVGTKKIGITAFQTVSGPPIRSLLEESIKSMESVSDVQIAYVHWGEEYATTHSLREEELAKFLIDSGIDIVVGHHPHVVQDIGVYKGKPIFYSLGNFIFDQYFSTDVEEGIGLALTTNGGEQTINVIPFTSVHHHSQPERMTSREEKVLFTRIFEPIKNVKGVDAKKGTITFR